MADGNPMRSRRQPLTPDTFCPGPCGPSEARNDGQSSSDWITWSGSARCVPAGYPQGWEIGGWFAGAVKRAAVQPITPHDLRHSCASLAISAGVNVLALQRMLGHTSAKVTLDTYADLFDDDLDAVAVTLHGRYSPQNVGKMWAQRGQESL